METDVPDIPPYNPAPWCFNAHVHTIGRSLLSQAEKPPHQRLAIPTPDEDFLEIDVAERGQDKPVVALFHGLEGSTDRYYMVEMMRTLYEARYTVVGVNFRSCGSRLNRRRRFYHSGETDDYATVFNWIRSEFGNRPIGAVGFSLGGNALLKYLGETGDSNPLFAAAAVSVPYDLALGSQVISRGFNRIYEYRFIRTLRKKLEEKRERYPDLPRFDGHTIYEFDDQVTANIHGFEDADDYYKRCSARQFVQDIRTPTLLVHSRRDPLCPIKGMPFEKVRRNPSLSYVFTEEGGHVGFWSIPQGWLNRCIMRYLDQKLTDGPYHMNM